MKKNLKEIKRLTKSIKLQIPLAPEFDDTHNMLDAIIIMCDECIGDANRISDLLKQALPQRSDQVLVTVHEPGVTVVDLIKVSELPDSHKYLIYEWNVAHALNLNTLEGLSCELKYFSKGEYSTGAGIPKNQPFHQQIEWARNKGAVRFWIIARWNEQEEELHLTWNELTNQFPQNESQDSTH